MPEARMGLVAGAFAVGIALAACAPIAACIAAAASLAAAAAILAPRYRSAAAIALAVFVLGTARYMVARSPAPSDISNMTGVAQFEGTVYADPQRSADDVLTIVLRVSRAQTAGRWQPAVGKVQARVHGASELPEKPEYGSRVRLSVRPYQPSPPTNPGQFSYREYLARQGIYTCVSVRRHDQLTVLPGQNGSPMVQVALAAKRSVERAIEKTHSPRAASLICGTVLGSYAYMSDETLRHFAATGTMHILAASGYNCYVLMFIAIPLLRAMRFSPRMRVPVALGLLAMYLVMVGCKPSLVRASIMSAIVVMAAPLDRVCNTRNAFFVAGFVVLMLNPLDLFDVGFQLSFLAVWALLSVMPVIESMLRRAGVWSAELSTDSLPWYSSRRVFGPIVAAGVGTLAITLVTAPVMAYNFNTFSLTALPANMAIVMSVPLIFADGFASALAVHVPLLGSAIGFIGSLLADMTLAVVGWFGSMKHSAVSVATPPIGAIGGFYLVLYAGTTLVRSRCAND